MPGQSSHYQACCSLAGLSRLSSNKLQTTVRTARLDRPGRSGAYVGLPSLACNVIRNRVVGGKAACPPAWRVPPVNGSAGRSRPERNERPLSFEGAATVCDGHVQHLRVCPVSWLDRPDTTALSEDRPPFAGILDKRGVASPTLCLLPHAYLFVTPARSSSFASLSPAYRAVVPRT